jgi:hypothetical protein
MATISPPGIPSEESLGSPSFVQQAVVLTLTADSIYQLSHQGQWIFDVDFGPSMPYSDVTPIHGDTVEDLDDAIAQVKKFPKSVWRADVSRFDASSYRTITVPDLQAIRIEFLRFTGGLNKKDWYGEPIGNPNSQL